MIGVIKVLVEVDDVLTPIDKEELRESLEAKSFREASK